MPVDPSISLGVGQNVPKPQPLDPMALIGNLTAVQNQMNTNTQFKLTNAARQRAGQIIAGALDEDDAIAQLQGDKLVMGYYPEALKNIRDLQTQMATLQNIGVDTAGKRQGQVDTALGVFAKSVPTLMALIDKYDMKGINAQLDANERLALATTTDPVARKGIKDGLASKRAALLEGLPDDPTAAQAELRMRTKGLLVGGGVTPDVLQTYTGIPGTQQQGGNIQPTQTDVWTGVQKPIGPVIPKAAEPGYQAPGAVPVGPNGVPLTSPNGVPAITPAANPTTPTAGTNPQGQPLFDPNAITPPYANKKVGNIGQGIAFTPTEQAAEEDLQKEFNGPEQDSYKASVAAQRSIAEIGHALDIMQSGDKFLQPGSAATMRLTLGKAVNSVAELLGKAPVLDLKQVAAGEAGLKDIVRTGFSLAKDTDSTPAQATITAAMSAVPGIENTYFGGQLIVKSIEAALQHEMDRREFKDAYSGWAGGLKNAEVEFNKRNPITSYMESAIKQFGMDPKGGWLPVDEFAQQIAPNRDTMQNIFPPGRDANGLTTIEQYVSKGYIDYEHGLVLDNVLRGMDPKQAVTAAQKTLDAMPKTKPGVK